jgi:hypothetical protein
MSAPFQSLALLVAVLAVGCRSHPEPARQLASDADIRAKILGTWAASTFEGLSGPFSFTFDADGSVSLVRLGVATNQTNWRAGRGWVVIAPQQTLPSSSLDHWAIWHVDDHELVFRRGWSTAGSPEKFTR